MTQPRMDFISEYAGPDLSETVLWERLAHFPLNIASFLRPANLALVAKHAEHRKALYRFFQWSLIDQRAALVTALQSLGVYPQKILEALQRVPRHLCVPTSKAALSYWNGSIIVRGTVAVPAPWLAAYVATHLKVSPGAKVLVFGVGYGFCSVFFADLVGRDGIVTALEIDEDCVVRVRRLIHALGIKNLKVIHGDALNAARTLGRHDCIWSSLSCAIVPDTWWELVAEPGRLGVFMPSPGAVGPPDEQRSGHRWWQSVSLRILRGDSSCECEMPSLINPPLQRDLACECPTPEMYPGLLENETRLLSFLCAVDTAGFDRQVFRQSH